MDRVVVIGGGYAGVLAAIRVAHRLGGDADVLLVSDADVLWERIRLHEAAASGRDARRPIASLLAGTGCRFLHARVDSVDRERRTITAGGVTIPYDQLIVAIGSVVDRDAIPGAREHALAIEPGDVARLHAIAACGGRVVVGGAGLTGLETAAELAEAHPGLGVTLISAHEVGERLDPRAADHVRRVLAGLGVTLREHVRVDRIERGAVVIGDERVPFDACVVAAGFRGPEALRRWGFPLDAHGRARVDGCLRLEGTPTVHVAGDAAVVGEVIGSPLPGGCKTAMPMGVHAAENVARALRGEAERAFDWRDTGLCISLGRREAVVQTTDVAGRPQRLFFRGYAGVAIKEIICRYTVKSIELERDRVFEYRFLRTGGRRALPAPRVEAA